MEVGRKVPGPGVMGVLVGGRVAVGVTKFTGICKTCPTNREFGFVMLFSSIIASMVLLNLSAMAPSESPEATVYSSFVPRGKFGGMGVAVGSCISGLGSRIT